MYILTTDRPTDDRPLISKNSNGHISATDHPIHFMFGSIATISAWISVRLLLWIQSSVLSGNYYKSC